MINPTFDEIMEMELEPALDADLQAIVDAAIDDASRTQQVRNSVHALMEIAEHGTRRDLYRAMRQAFG
jgi:hypothetical protein